MIESPLHSTLILKTVIVYAFSYSLNLEPKKPKEEDILLTLGGARTRRPLKRGQEGPVALTGGEHKKKIDSKRRHRPQN